MRDYREYPRLSQLFKPFNTSFLFNNRIPQEGKQSRKYDPLGYRNSYPFKNGLRVFGRMIRSRRIVTVCLLP